MTTTQPTEYLEDRIPLDGIREGVHELIDLYGGSLSADAGNSSQFILPLRRGVPTAGGIECSVSWVEDGEGEGTVKLVCDRDVDASRLQRVALLGAGVVGSFFFMLWPFFPNLGPLAWVGGVLALAAYFLSLRRTAGGIAADFLQRLASRQRSLAIHAVDASI